MLLYEELSSQIIKSAFEVYNSLGCGFLEKVYENALYYELKWSNVPVEQQKVIKVNYKGFEVGNFISDLMVDDKIIIEIKAVKYMEEIHELQLYNYLKMSGKHVGLLINFGDNSLKFRRIVNKTRS